MRFGRNVVYGLLALAGGAVIAGAYVLNTREDSRTAGSAAAVQAQRAQSSMPAADPVLPPWHPTFPAAGEQARRDTPGRRVATAPPPAHPPVAVAPKGADARSGRVEVNPARAFTHFRVGNNSVTAIYADGPVMWLGTSGGMVRYDTAGREFKTYDTRNGLLANGILYLGKLQGRIVAGTYGGGMSMLNQDGQTWEHFGPTQGLANTFVYDVFETTGGDVWIATGAGVNRVRNGALKDRAKWELYTAENTGGGLPHNRVYRIALGRDGGLWFATRGGPARLLNGKWQYWTPASEFALGAEAKQREIASDHGAAQLSRAPAEPGQKTPSAETRAAFNSNHVAALEVARDGKVWVGTRGAGIARYDGRTWTRYRTAEGLPSDQISTLNVDPEGRLWIGTKNGLALFEDGKFRVLTAAHGLLGEHVYSVTTARDGDMWVGGYGGVAHLRRAALN